MLFPGQSLWSCVVILIDSGLFWSQEESTGIISTHCGLFLDPDSSFWSYGGSPLRRWLMDNYLDEMINFLKSFLKVNTLKLLTVDAKEDYIMKEPT